MSEEEKKDNGTEEQSESAVEETPAKEKTEAPPKGGKFNKKKILKLGALVLAIIFIMLVTSSIVLGSVIKGAVNHVLPTVTGTPSGMGSCYLNIFTGTLNITDFVIGNPDGYKTEHAFKLREVHVDIALTSLLSDKIVIEDIIVDNMEVSFETKMTETNIGVIKENIDKLSKKEETPDKEEPESETAEEDTGKGKKLQIDNFMFINSKVNLHAGVGTSVPLPEIQITGIGADSQGGASIPEVSEEVITKLYIAILEAVKGIRIDTEGLKEGTDKAIEKAKEGTDSVIKGVKGLFGGEEE